MPNHAGRDEVLRRKQKLEGIFAMVDGASLSGELASHYARYLCVLVSGHIEQSAKELVMQYVRLRSEQRVTRLVGRQLNRVRNLDQESLKALIDNLDAEWWPTIESGYPDELAAFDSVVAVRNSISHGGDGGITLATIKQYFAQVSTVLSALSDLLDRRS